MRRLFLALIWLCCALPAVAAPTPAETLWAEVQQLIAAGQVQVAEDRATALLGVQQQQLGPTSIEVGRTLTIVAMIERAKGDVAAAQSLEKRAMAIHESALGKENDEVVYIRSRLGTAPALGGIGPTVYALNKKADALYKLGNYDGARAVLLRVLELRQESLGPNHPDVASTLVRLAAVVEAQHQPKAAAALRERADTIRRSQR